MKQLADLNIQIFADGADLKVISQLSSHLIIKGFTTNPTTMRKAGVLEYRTFALEMLKLAGNRPVSFEVFSDDFIEMEKQAREIASWGNNIYVKIPITNTHRESSGELVRRLSQSGIKLNVTALLTIEQVKIALRHLSVNTKSFISIFAGRIADTGQNPIPIMSEAVKLLKMNPQAQLIWASPRELLDIFNAESIGCHIITVTNDILSKLPLIGKDLNEYSLDTVKMFYQDALKAGFHIDIP